jgi:hypothetical protein
MYLVVYYGMSKELRYIRGERERERERESKFVPESSWFEFLQRL